MTVVIQVPQLVEFVLSNPKFFPGLHTTSQPRTSTGLQNLDPQRQLQAIWNAMSDYLREVLESGKGVRIDHIGAFAFEPVVAPYGNPKNFRSSALQLRPCFLPDGGFKATLPRYAGKEETPLRGGSIYQQGINMIYLNKVPIAAGLFLKTQVVADGISALFKAVKDLSSRGYNLDLDFKFCRWQIIDGDLKVSLIWVFSRSSNKFIDQTKFSPSLVREAQKDARQWPTRDASANPLPTLAQALADKTDPSKPPQPISATWKNPNVSKAMTGLIKRPDSPKIDSVRQRTLQLGIMSLDLNSCQPKKVSKCSKKENEKQQETHVEATAEETSTTDDVKTGA
ncbi:conserved hypothetical protein [Perkinsus marinus ATCC 50983]|uniref:CCDC81 HU domain-containing protein n=1 Tax=Perkinsus marinus (strain ATCC 50983 / TXsc) TaxID=423536 RepID=C5L3M6_PERM5|nr:conserved hypothetical protein [Perkinsus marinus ATCC 50983]EER08605.1 conserved hypothetical protein [Perkinsus marinus ATCC 50983]|eukprot:XP_002776789.1 conserved hypothetical protein [Perkinsus marinus ATCC 50983]